MAAHRYWRVVSLEAYGTGDLELSCFHLFNAATRVDMPALLTATTVPVTGAVASLQDDDLTTAVRWAMQSVASLVLAWDFGGSPADVTGIRLAGDSEVRFPLILRLQYSDDLQIWTDFATAAGIRWPGVASKTADGEIGIASMAPSGYYKFEETAGTVMVDSSAFARHGSYLGGLLPTAPGLTGGDSRALRTTPTQYHTVPNVTLPGASEFTLAFKIQYTTAENAVIFERGGNNLSIQSTGPEHVSLGIPAGGLAFVSGGVSAAVVVGSRIALNDGFAHSMVIGYGVAIGSCYMLVDGVDVTLLLAYRNVVADGVAWQIGSRYGAVGFGGALDELVFFPRLLTVAEAKDLYVSSGAQLRIQRNAVKGRSAPVSPFAVGTGPVMIYGVPQLVDPVHLTVQSGSVKDYTTGVMGTGRGRVAGTVKEKGTPDAPVYRKVRLIRERDSMLIREVWSHPVTGAYSFDYVDELQLFTVLSYDHTGAFRAVVASGITPELIP